MKAKILPAILFSLIVMNSLTAQNEVEVERNSLSGIKQFGVVVNVEKPVSLNEPSLNVVEIRKKIVEHFADIPASVLSNNQLRENFDLPYFYIHVNIMQHDNGIYPFAIEMRFYQPVKITLKKNMDSIAATWHSGYVGMVSYDRLNEIPDVMLDATNGFKDEFNQVN